MSDSKKLIPTKRPQTSKNPIMRQTSGIKQGLNKTLPRKSKLPGLNKVQQPHHICFLSATYLLSRCRFDTKSKQLLQ
jgi:hypothetical protein